VASVDKNAASSTTKVGTTAQSANFALNRRKRISDLHTPTQKNQ